MPRYLPICVEVASRRAVVVGGGQVATERALELAALGARVLVISPDATEELRRAAEEGRVELLLRRWQAGDTEGAFLVVAATDDPGTNRAVYEEASGGDRLVNVCDDPEHCTFIFPSRFERGALTVSIFTHGTSPALSRRVRRELEAWLGPEYGALADLLAALRPRVMAMPGLTQPDRQRIFERIVYSEAVHLFREGNPEAACALAETLLSEALASTGRSAPAAAPGDPDPDPGR